MKEKSFKGRHNKNKSFVFLTMYKRNISGLRKGLGIQEIALLANVSYDYLRARLTLLTRWKYLRNRRLSGYKSNIYTYTLTRKGKKFCEEIPTDVLKQYLKELEAHWEFLKGDSQYWYLFNP